VPKTKYCCSRKVKDLPASDFWAGLLASGQATRLRVRIEANIPKNPEAVNAGLPWKVFIASQGH